MMISVLTPSFNSGASISRAIESVLRQDYHNWEHIVIDGFSTDNTIEILNSYSHLIWQSAPDKGQSDAMNKAFGMARGDIVMYLNADDEFSEGIFSFVVDTLNNVRDMDMVIMNLRMSNQGNVSIRVPSVSLREILRYWPARFPLNPVSYAYRRSLQERIGPFPIDNHYSMDYWFLLRCYLYGHIIKTNFLGGTYYIDGTNKSADVVRSKASLKAVRNAFLNAYFYRPEVIWFLIAETKFILERRFKRLFKVGK